MLNLTLLIAPTMILIGIIVALAFLILRKLNNINQLINQIIKENHKCK